MIIEKIDDWGGNVVPGEPVDGDLVRITHDNGAIQEKIYRVPVVPEEPNRIYVHVTASGGDGNNPLGIANNGTDSLNITFTLREGTNPASAIQTGIQVNWNFTFRGSDGFIYDLFKVDFVNGVANFAYSTTGRTAKVFMKSGDVNEVYENAIITLVGEPMFLVYRDLT